MFPATALTAALASAARVYLNGCMIKVLRFSAYLAKRVCRLASVNLSDRVYDIWICAASTDVAAHSLSDLIIRQRKRTGLLPKIRRNVTEISIFCFVQ
jgi:hypothetical protein